MLRFKDDSISPGDLRPQLLLALIVADQVYAKHGCEECVITSLNDGGHSVTSLHYAGAAADLRVRDLVAAQIDPDAVAMEISQRLNIHYDVIYEGHGTPNAHIHVEYQPRRQ